MDRAKMVISRVEEARKLIDRMAEDGGLAVSDAFWIESIEDDQWTLYVGSPAIHEIGIRGGYGALIEALKSHPEVALNADDMRPRPPDDPVMAEAVDFLRRYPAAEAFRLGGVFLNGHFIRWAYLYPILLDGKTGEQIRGGSLAVG